MKKQWLGLLLVIIGSIFWGSSGPMTDFTLNTHSISPWWIVGVSFISSGLLLLAEHKFVNHQSVSLTWTSVKQLALFGLTGMMPTQLLYFIAIKFSNASTATILQFTGPVFTVIYLAFKTHQFPSRIDISSILMAGLGTFLLVTQGSLHSLSISILGLVFGLGAGVASSIYALLSGKLLKKYNAEFICGWGFIFGSIPLLPILITTKLPRLNISFIGELLFIVIVGTMLAYLFFVASINYLSPTISGILSSFEPLTATFLSVCFLNLKLNVYEVIGIALILLMAVMQSLPQRRNE